ncbi:MAG: sigma-70 family RNA polymerase sigma factor [Actinomycetota bacterium]|nr:sigma-70 family RNA polymerase sigma factor [Actinomycetota bacterium]
MPRSVHPGALDAARVGEGWALERVYSVLGRPVLGYLAAQGASDPEGALNEVFLRALRRLDRFHGDSEQLRSWVFAIAHNLVVDERRTTARRPPAIPLDGVVDRAGGDAEDDALDRLGDGRIRATLDLLAPDQRDVVLLRFVADLSLAEVADVTGRTVGATKALQRRALESLRRRLGDLLPAGVSR